MNFILLVCFRLFDLMTGAIGKRIPKQVRSSPWPVEFTFFIHRRHLIEMKETFCREGNNEMRRIRTRAERTCAVTVQALVLSQIITRVVHSLQFGNTNTPGNPKEPFIELDRTRQEISPVLAPFSPSLPQLTAQLNQSWGRTRIERPRTQHLQPWSRSSKPSRTSRPEWTEGKWTRILWRGW